MSIDWEIEELACRVCGKSEEESEQVINDANIDDLLLEKYDGVDFELYCQIVKDLLPFTPKIKAAVSGETYHAFISGNTAIVKQAAT